MSRRIKVMRTITIEGDEEWVAKVLQNSWLSHLEKKTLSVDYYIAEEARSYFVVEEDNAECKRPN